MLDAVAVLLQHGLVEIMRVHPAGNGLADQRAEHERGHSENSCVISNTIKMPVTGAHDRAEARAHAHHRQVTMSARVTANSSSTKSGDHHADHAAEKQGRRKNAAAAAESIAADVAINLATSNTAASCQPMSPARALDKSS